MVSRSAGCSMRPFEAVERTIENQELLLDENGLGDHRTDAARTQESGERSDDMDEKEDEIAHLSILAPSPRNGG